MYIEILLNQTLPKDPKLRVKDKREAWKFEVIIDFVGTPQLYKKTTEFNL